MTGAFTARVPTLWHGRGVAQTMTARLTAHRATIVVADAAVRAPFLPARPRGVAELDAATVRAETIRDIAELIARERPEVVLAVGGGTVLDTAKIAALALAPDRSLQFVLERAQSEALVYLPEAPPPVDLVTVPTTLGTSSETNGVAILTNTRGHRLVLGRALRPRHALLDPENLLSLSEAHVREGALEAFLRLAGASTGPTRSARAHGDAVALGRAILETADGRVDSGDVRLRLGRLSAATQRSAALRGPDPYAPRHWYVANEVAFHLGVRKMSATAAIIASVWQRICDRDSRWGDRASLEGFWACASPRLRLPPDPARGIAELVDRWGIARPPTPSSRDIDRIAVAIENAWGARRPMLPGLVGSDFRDVLRASAWSDRRGVSHGVPTPREGGERHGPRHRLASPIRGAR
ncbi:daptide-type RiPP biosynthesis dehydogenase [Microbacterium hydrocarbonoxydans]|uniref:daptide-type RiPP biosynthesis dehydogenase n=1 Tax=Microbacterium hydrocarbonoxydans TaxID=273678 RepID=UPI00203F4D99|nr:daptide-type RiPP biosynthesis dehydogenase [Microbacterium hydrocarbonoxydans]MCM3779983.1 iron-containing alcohol dehydrogenase [Microbacterium hydrocarbonoxydans]